MPIGTSYEITITMSDETTNRLVDEGFYLYGFKAVNSSTGGGMPLVWFVTDDYATSTDITWQEEYQAYTSRKEIIPGGTISGINSYDIALGQTLTVDNISGTGTVGGSPGSSRRITVDNETTRPFTSGIAQLNHVAAGQTTKATPLAAFPLHGRNLDFFTPVEKVLLMFATAVIETSTVVEQAFGPGLLVDLTGVAQREVTYDIDYGWGPTKPNWTTPVDSLTLLTPLLIQQDRSLPVSA
ncbi:hypothetical protein [Streptomyces sp. NBC_00893]|uniref:hypothetical protein n=1 Tax=Streptomyces sp. NBC_00893 TaxID=2975862 RepID=UPI00224F3848|nr:hypothetical protein [Streptomyces sp. NBC_00893]MCX4847855.1 hypothetical protein [Streptomyces sp. NBC_00893]